MSVPSLHTRLQTLDEQIKHARARLAHKGILSADHQVTSEELHKRFRALSEKVQTDIASEEAQGHNVSALEASIRQWINSLEIDMD